MTKKDLSVSFVLGFTDLIQYSKKPPDLRQSAR
jgi:hypothetical protein